MCVAQVVQPQVNPDPMIAQELYTIQRSVQRCVQVRYTITKWYQSQATINNGRRRGRGYKRGQEAEQKQVEIMEDRRDKVQAEYHDRIMDSGASFHATYCKEELERFKLRSDKVRLADDKTLDIAGVGDVFLKTSFGTSWTLKDVRYIPGLKRRLISVRQLDEEGYHVFFGDRQWKVTKGSLVVAHGNKRGSLYMVEVHPEGIGAIINGSGSAAVWFGEAEESFLHNVSEDKKIVEVGAIGVTNGIVMLKMVPETPLPFGVAERLSRTFRAESTGIRAEAPKMLWADSVSTAYLIYRIPYVPIGLLICIGYRQKDEKRSQTGQNRARI
ncbi:retrovirus-related pol polyprotein from transposon TNT 1-94 [Tanacetum coccineum]